MSEISSARPQIIMLVRNGIRGDSRVQKTALSLAKLDPSCILIGFTTKQGQGGFGKIDGCSTLLLESTAFDAPPNLAFIQQFISKTSPLFSRRLVANLSAILRTYLASFSMQQGLQNLLRGAGTRILLVLLLGWEKILSFIPKVNLGSNEALAHEIKLNRDFAQQILPLLKQTRPRIVHLHDFHCADVGLQLMEALGPDSKKIKWIYDAHEDMSGMDQIPKSVREHYLTCEEKIFPLVDKILTVSPSLAGNIERRSKRISSTRVILNCPQNDENVKSSVNLRSALKIAADDILMVHSGNINTRRGSAFLVACLPLLPQNLKLVFLCNNDSQFRKLERSAKLLGVADRLLSHPYVPQDEVARFLRTADFGVLATTHHGNAEVSLPNKLFEYIQAGIPTLTSDIREAADFVKRKKIGHVFVANDWQSFVEAARRMISDLPEFRVRFREEREYFRRTWSWEAQENTLLEVYRELFAAQPNISANEDI